MEATGLFRATPEKQLRTWHCHAWSSDRAGSSDSQLELRIILEEEAELTSPISRIERQIAVLCSFGKPSGFFPAFLILQPGLGCLEMSDTDAAARESDHIVEDHVRPYLLGVR
jgi:hypothetical protein